MKNSTKFSPEVRERAVRMVFESRGDHGSRGSTIIDCLSPSDIFLLPKLRQTTTAVKPSGPSQPDSNQMASAIPGAIQNEYRRWDAEADKAMRDYRDHGHSAFMDKYNSFRDRAKSAYDQACEVRREIGNT